MYFSQVQENISGKKYGNIKGEFMAEVEKTTVSLLPF